MTEQRAKEIGILRTAGFPAKKIRRVFLLEGWILSTAGSLLGILGAVAYGRILMLGLRTWWVGAVGTQRLYLHISYRDLAAGAVTGMIFSLATIAWTLRVWAGVHLARC